MAIQITNEQISEYAEIYTSSEDELLFELNRQTYLRTELPIMISGHLQGRLLSMISKMICPYRILEIGTFTGYSALCLAEGLQENGLLISIDNHAEQSSMAQEYIKRSKFKKQIQLLLGDALEKILEIDEEFDLVFIDADKINYSNYFDLVFDKVKKGGFILADNVLFHGDVILKENINKNARAMQLYNEKIKSDNRIENVLLPIRDGIMISRKK